VTERVEMEKVATPADSVPVPRVAAPSMNVTVPVGVPPEDVTVAVKVTNWLKVEGLASEANAVVVVDFTTCEKIAEVSGRKLRSPP